MVRRAAVVQIGSVVKHRAAQGDADGAPEVAHQIKQPGGQLQARGRQAAQRQGHRWRDGKLLRQSAKSLREKQLVRPQSWVIGAKLYIDTAKPISPAISSQRRSTRLASHE